jgi:hypothetical protein
MPGLESALAPFTLKGFYLCTWGAAVGTNVWQTLVRLPSSVWTFIPAYLSSPSCIVIPNLRFSIDINHLILSSNPIVRSPNIPVSSSTNIRCSSIPPNPILLLHLNTPHLHSSPYSPLLPPFPHLLTYCQASLAFFRRGSTGFVDCCRTCSSVVEPFVLWSFRYQGHVREAQVGEVGG